MLGEREHVALSVVNPNDERIERLRELFPDAFSEGKVDWEKLRAALGAAVDDRPERYNFTWAGKRDAIKLVQMPTRATLTPAPEESVNFDTSQNLFIEGDNLEVLKLLYKSYFGRVKMIYIDPPYNTGNDFIYPDNFADPLATYLALTGQQDERGNLLTSNPETAGRYHSAWLSMMYPRLFLARQLLREDGVIFVSIDDHEVHNLRLLMNEIFGEENFLASVSWEKRFTRSNNAKLFASVKDTIMIYRRGTEIAYLRESRTEKSNSIYANPDNDRRGPWTSVSYVNPATRAARPNLVYKITNPHTGDIVEHPTNAWKFAPEQYEKHVQEKRLWWGQDGKYRYPRLKKFLSEVSDGIVPIDLWTYKECGTTDEGTRELEELVGKDVFDNPKPTRLVRRMLQLATSTQEGHIVLDFFAGSCTTAQAVLELNREDGGNRRFIMVQLPEPTGNTDFPTIADIGKERIRRVGAKIEREEAGKLDLKDRATPLDLGFRVFRLTPSYFRPWQGVAAPTTREYAAQMAMFQDLLTGDWRPEAIVWEAALKEGYSLTARVDEVPGIARNTVYRVTDDDRAQAFVICLDATLCQETINALALTADDLFICRDMALNDELAANLALQCRLKTL